LNDQLTEQSDNRILIVDDEECVRKVLAAHLEERYVCITAADAQEALVRLAEEPFALALLDVKMPGLSGTELLRKIMSDFPDVVVIMASGVDRSQRVLDALRLGAFDYLIKPFDFDVLQVTVERALERRALLRDGRRYKQDLERRNQKLAAQKAELERLQAQLVHSEKMASVGQLAAGVAHELNNPAGFVYSNIEGLSRYVNQLEQLLTLYDSMSLPPDLAAAVKACKSEIRYEKLLPDISSIIADCQEGAGRIRDIVLNLRTFSRLDEAEVKKIDIHAGIESTIRLLSQYYSSNHITLRRAYGDLPMVECFAGQLNQVWMNLLTNAAQAIGQGSGEVRIETSVEDDVALVQISDTGKGISAEDQRRIFDPFFTTKPVGEGTGLGLSISHSIIERHGGTIKVESSPGKGSTFTTRIPLNLKHPISKQQNQKISHLRRTIHV
jgi:two-component system NtrC family sensor kinase